MNLPRIKALATAVMGAALVVAVSGCDASEDADLDNGRDLFVQQCGQCHYLAEAGTTGQLGPDLDSAFAAARASGQDQDTFEGVTEAQISNPRQVDESDPSYMPPNLVEGDDLSDVAAYVASVAGVPGIQPPTSPGGEGGQIYANNGCGGCHSMVAAESVANIGPNLDENIAGQDAAMIEQSIVDPNAELSQGFSAGIMPAAYGDTIEPADLELLVKFLSTCAGQVENPTDGGEPTGPAFCFNAEE